MLPRLCHTGRPCPGWTLFDLLAGLCLTAVLLSLCVSSYAGMTADQSLKFEAKRLKAVLEQLTVDALQRESDIVLELEERGYAAKKDSARGGVLLQHRLKGPVRIEAAAKESRYVTLYRSGVSTPVTIVLGDGKDTCRVVLSLRSRVSMRCGEK